MRDSVRSGSWATWGTWAVALLAATSAGCGRAHPKPERVLLVVTDATHSAHLGCYGGGALTPAIDAVASHGRRYSRALSNNAWTLASTASLMTGQLQESHGSVTNHHALD